VLECHVWDGETILESSFPVTRPRDRLTVVQVDAGQNDIVNL